VGEGLGIGLAAIKDLGPLATQTLTEEELERMKNLGHNGPRNVEGLTMTHCVPNEHVEVMR
jgi:catalase